MRILAVDTSSERGSICVVDGLEVLGEVRLASSIQYSERLFRSVEFIFQHLPFQLSDVDLFAAARGPGSFTGLRVGLAAMEGFAAAHGTRVPERRRPRRCLGRSSRADSLVDASVSPFVIGGPQTEQR